MRIINQSQNIHFIGINGCGMKGLALYFSSKGRGVSGSDLKKTKLNDQRIHIYEGHHESHVKDKDLVIYSTAVSEDNIELKEARRMNIALLSRPETMTLLLEDKQSIGIAGVHGKTSTTGMIGQMMINAGMDPTVFVGGALPRKIQYGRAGDSPWVVFEADESDGSLVSYSPHYAVITNIELEHVDYFKDLNHIKSVFSRFIDQTSERIILCADDPVCSELIGQNPSSKFFSYGLSSGARMKAGIVTSTDQGLSFRVTHHHHDLGEFSLPLYGLHQVSNALAAISVGTLLELPLDIIKHTLSNFCGMERRFQPIGFYHGACVINDYAHHPQEVRASLNAARQGYKGKIMAVFQPHRYTRYRRFYKDFASVLKGFDAVVIAPIYHGHEENHDAVSSVSLYEILKDQKHKPIFIAQNLDQIRPLIDTIKMDYDVILMMGAGDIELVARELVSADVLSRPVSLA